MASIVDAFNDTFNDNMSYVKFVIYAIPVYFCADFFIKGQMSSFYLWATIVGILLLGLLTKGIHNVRTNNKEILTLNPLSLIISIIKAGIVVIPQLAVYYFIGEIITKNITIPLDIPHIQLIFNIIIWSILGAIVFTSYISFAKYLSIKEGYNYLKVIPASIDMLVSMIFAVPQFAIANVILAGPVAYLFWFFHIPFMHWGFIGFCSVLFIINISLAGNYFAQLSYEHLRASKNEIYEDHQINSLLNDMNTDRNI